MWSHSDKAGELLQGAFFIRKGEELCEVYLEIITVNTLIINTTNCHMFPSEEAHGQYLCSIYY